MKINVKSNPASGEFLGCLASCTGKSLADVIVWLADCNLNPICWIGKAGSVAIKCIADCAVGVDAAELLEEEVVDGKRNSYTSEEAFF